MKMPRRRTFGTKPKPFSPLAPKAPSVKPTNLPVQTRPRAIPAMPPTTPGQKATPAVPPTPMKRATPATPNRLQPNPVQPVRAAPVTPQGLDKLHTIVNRETGETMQVTQQAWKDMAKGSDATYRRGGPANKGPATNKGRKP